MRLEVGDVVPANGNIAATSESLTCSNPRAGHPSVFLPRDAIDNPRHPRHTHPPDLSCWCYSATVAPLRSQVGEASVSGRTIKEEP